MRGRADTAVCCCRSLSVRPVAHDETYAIRQIRQRPPYWYVKPPNHACHDIHDTTIRRHSAVQRPIRLNRACHDIHDEQNTPDAPDTPDNPQRPSPTTIHKPRPQQERPAAGIQPTTGFRPINALLPRGRNITEFCGSAAGAAVHHSLHLVGVKTVRRMQCAHRVIKLIKRDQRRNTNLGRGNHQHVDTGVTQCVEELRR